MNEEEKIPLTNGFGVGWKVDKKDKNLYSHPELEDKMKVTTWTDMFGNTHTMYKRISKDET